MAQFNYLNELNSLATIDGPITRGPLQRWVKKSNNENINPALSASLKNISNINLSSCNQSMQKLSISGNHSGNNSNISNNKTPTRIENKKGKKTPSKNKSPGNFYILYLIKQIGASIFVYSCIPKSYFISAMWITGRSTTPTPNKASKTPNKADRFIPSRSNSNYDLCHYMVSCHHICRHL